MGGMFGGMWIWWLLALALLVIIVLAILRGGARDATSAIESPEEVLKRRFAKGEIGEEEYHRRLEDLRK